MKKGIVFIVWNCDLGEIDLATSVESKAKDFVFQQKLKGRNRTKEEFGYDDDESDQDSIDLMYLSEEYTTSYEIVSVDLEDFEDEDTDYDDSFHFSYYDIVRDFPEVLESYAERETEDDDE